MLENGANLHVNERQKIRHRKWSGFTCKRASVDTTLALGLLEKEEEEELERRMPNGDYFTLRGA